MTLGKITGKQTFNESKEFIGMDITARFLNENGKFNSLSFHYAFYTNDLRGKVESVLMRFFKKVDYPSTVTDVKVD